MAYLNLDDGFADHEKVDTLSDGAFRLHVAGLCYCAKNLTDGVVRKVKIPRLMPTYRPAYLHELTTAPKPMWLPHPDGYVIHDYLDWNKSKAWWEEKREKDAKRLAEWRAKQAENAERKGG